jgi:hypothetical protein
LYPCAALYCANQICQSNGKTAVLIRQPVFLALAASALMMWTAFSIKKEKNKKEFIQAM